MVAGQMGDGAPRENLAVALLRFRLNVSHFHSTRLTLQASEAGKKHS
jgi:hypothetical protein